MTSDLIMTAALDRQLVWDRGDSRRYLRVRVTAPPAATPVARPPMNLGLALDTSGSMSGGRIDAARRAAIGALDGLGAEDRLTLVSFASDATVRLAGVEMDEAGRRDARSVIAAMEAGGGTNLSEGWFQAVISATESPSRAGQATRIVILSDGHANAGVVGTGDLARHAQELLARGVTTSALGIGDGYDEQLLGSIAEAGGGRLLDAEECDEIETVLAAEVDASAQTAADALVLTLDLPAGVMAEALGATTARRTRNGVEIPMGALLRGKPRDVFIALTLPPGRSGEQVKLALTLHGRDAATGAAMAPLAAHARLTFAEARENTDQPRDTDLSLGAAGAWMGQILRVMAQLNAREPAAAREYAETQSRYFHRYVEGLPGGAELLEQMALLRARATREWDARLRKEIHYLAQRNFNSVEDFRGPDKESWAERLRRS